MQDTDPRQNNVFVVPTGNSFDYGLAFEPVYLGGYDDLVFNPDLWELTALDGTVMRISEKRGLVWVKEPNGNTLTIDRFGIHSSTGVGVDFTRDGSGRITAIRDPKGNVLRSWQLKSIQNWILPPANFWALLLAVEQVVYRNILD